MVTSAGSQEGANLVEPGPAYDLGAGSNARFLAAYAAQPGVVTRPSGLLYRVVVAGDGASISSQMDRVRVTYDGRLIDGTQFDATEPGQMAEFTANALIPGWIEALAIMREGDEWELVVPSNLGYGAQGAGGGVIPPNQTLVFTMVLVEVVQEGPAGPAPQIASTAIEGDVESILVEGTQRVEPWRLSARWKDSNRALDPTTSRPRWIFWIAQIAARRMPVPLTRNPDIASAQARRLTVAYMMT